MRKFLLVMVVMLTLVSVPVFAAADYANAKGDFKIFYLGEKLDKVVDKYYYLIERNLVDSKQSNLKTGDDGGVVFLKNASVFNLNTDCTLYVSNRDGLRRIIVRFENAEITQFDLLWKDLVTQSALPLFNSLYSLPVIRYQYPTLEEMRKRYQKTGSNSFAAVYPIAVWATESKVLYLEMNLRKDEEKEGCYITIDIMTKKEYNLLREISRNTDQDFN